MNYKPGALRDSLRDRLLNKMIRNVGGPTDKWKVLVVDRAALRILAAAIRVNELVNEGISIVEMLDMRREPLPRIPAIYFVSPTAETVQHLAQESPTQYRNFHLFFTSRLPDYLMDQIRTNSSLLRKVRSLVEMDIQFLALESRLFSLDRPAASLPQLHAQSQKENKEEMSIVSERLSHACTILAPDVEWTVRTDATSSSSRAVASLVKEQLETLRIEHRNKKATEDRTQEDSNTSRQNEEQENDENDEKPTKATLLVIDRVSDLVSPLIHEFTYQTMAHDLLKLDYQKPGGAHYEMKPDAQDDKPAEQDKNKKKWVQLDDEETDPIWPSIRSTFIEEALTEAQNSFKKFLSTDAAFKIRNKETSDLNIQDMSAAVRALPNSQLLADKHTMHIKAICECLEVCSKDNIKDLALVEQDMAIGRQSDGTRIRPEFIVETAIEILGDTSVPAHHRVRLVMIIIVILDGHGGLGGENSLFAFSTSFRSKMKRNGFEKLVEMTSDLSSAVKGLEQLAQIAKKGYENVNPKGKVQMDEDDSMTAKLKNKYASRQVKKKHEKSTAARHKRHGLEEEGSLHYDVARYHPPLRSVMMDLIDEELNKENFPIVGSVSVDSIIANLGNSSLRAQEPDEGSISKNSSFRPKFAASNIKSQSAAVAGLVKSMAKGDTHRSKDSDSDDGRFRMAEQGHLFMVFVLGGVCYSEVRAMYEVCAKRDANMVIGGSQIITPKSFIDALTSVADPVIRIRVMLPPLPIELAQSRAERAKALEAGREIKPERAAPRERTAVTAVTDNNPDLSEEEDAEENTEELVEVVGYKKSRMRFFGRKKR